MKRLILFALVLASCGEPNIPDNSSFTKKPTAIDSTKVDSVYPISITIDKSIKVTASNVNVEGNKEVRSLHMYVDQNNNIEYLKVNNTVLYQEAETNHTLVWLEDSKILVQKGNTIDGILTALRSEGYNYNRNKLYKCNPNLERTGLLAGQILNVDCD